MTYVAEPYLHVTDQVLTGLTGGVAREAHRFFAGANQFSFEFDSDTVFNESVSVIGQVDQAFFAFQQGRDYFIDNAGMLRFFPSDDDKTQPANGATWPDEGSEFYIGYYHTESDKALLTDRNVGSLTRTLAESFARELAVLRKQLELVYRSGFVDTAEGTALDMVVALLGVNRKSREFATGTVRFYRDTPAPADIFIPEEARVSTALNPPVGFTTVVAKTLRRGQLSVEVDVRADAKGASGIVGAREISVINQPILGIVGVMNDAPTVFGGASEADAELRARVKKVAERAGKATPRAIINALTEVEGLKENDLKVVEELQLRPGVVQVFVARKPTPALASEVQEAILNSRAAGIRVEHNLAVALPFSPKDSLPTDDAREDGESSDAPPGEDFTLPLICDVMVFPDNPRITGAEKSTLEQAIQATVKAYVEASAIGGTIVYNQVVSDIMLIAGVLDIVLVLKAGTDGGSKGMRNLRVPDGRRAVIENDRDITVHFAGDVNFDIRLRVTPKGGATMADIQKEIKARLVEYFTGNPHTVTAADLTARLGVSELYTIQPNGLSWTVEYDQAGLVIREQGSAGSSTEIATGDRAILRDVKVE
jgi:uncharacterized phage protein gp47/JayE